MKHRNSKERMQTVRVYTGTRRQKIHKANTHVSFFTILSIKMDDTLFREIHTLMQPSVRKGIFTHVQIYKPKYMPTETQLHNYIGVTFWTFPCTYTRRHISNTTQTEVRLHTRIATHLIFPVSFMLRSQSSLRKWRQVVCEAQYIDWGNFSCNVGGRTHFSVVKGTWPLFIHEFR